MGTESLLVFIIIGAIAGWLAGLMVKGSASDLSAISPSALSVPSSPAGSSQRWGSP